VDSKVLSGDTAIFYPYRLILLTFEDINERNYGF
jgi:hypothetical protein